MLTGPPQEQVPPTFRKPPVVEVVCGIQFAPLPQWLTAHYGLFWDRVKDRYSRSEDKPPLGKLNVGEYETSEPPELSVLPPLRRVFLIDTSDSYLIQIQQNRFLHNWRKVDGGEYPRFKAAYARFTEQWQQFKMFLETANVSLTRVEAYELTYVNIISAPDAVFPRDIWQFLNFYREFPLTATGAPPRVMSLKVGWPLDGGVGKLALTVKHGKRQDSGADVLSAEFAAIGPAGRDAADMESWFRVAHLAIVNTFAALTTPKAHEMWERVE